MEAIEETKTEQTDADETKNTEETKTEKESVEQDKAALDLGAEFDKKAAEDSDGQTAYTAETDEAKAKAETEEKAKAEAEAGKKDSGDEVDESLLERAEKVGLSRDKAGEFSSKEDLERTVVLLEESQSEKQQTPEEKEAEEKVKAEAEAKAEEDKKPYDCGLDPEEYDEGLIKVLNDLGTMLKQRVVSLEEGQLKHASTLKSSRVTQHTDWLDSKVNRLADEELTKIYGKGDIDDFEDDSPEFKARAALDTTISKIAAGLRSANKRVPSRNKLFDMAIEKLHKGKSKVDTKTKTKLEARAKTALGGGSGKVSAESVEQKALQTQKEFDAKIDED
jgi:colicin import membrane protein